MKKLSEEDQKRFVKNRPGEQARFHTPNHAWVVYAGGETQRPQAAFSNRRDAEILIGHMIGAIDPVLCDRSQITEMNLVIDQYVQQVSSGKMPFEIILNSAGEVFDSRGPNDGIPAIEEPVLMNEKLHALAGTFWGRTSAEAVESAQKLFEQLKQKGETIR
jgi:hypothetical protein